MFFLPWLLARFPFTIQYLFLRLFSLRYIQLHFSKSNVICHRSVRDYTLCFEIPPDHRGHQLWLSQKHESEMKSAVRSPAHGPANALRLELALALVTALVRRGGVWGYLGAALFGSCSCGQISCSFMSMSHQKRKTQRAGGMTPPLLLGDPAQFQKILRVVHQRTAAATAACHGSCPGCRVLGLSASSQAPREYKSVWNAEYGFGMTLKYGTILCQVTGRNVVTRWSKIHTPDRKWVQMAKRKG